MTIRESKIKCSFGFQTPDRYEGPFPAEVELFEHDYDEHNKFWYGVARVNCEFRQSYGLIYNDIESIEQVRYCLQFEDGRAGIARFIGDLTQNWPENMEDIVIRFVGFSPLQIPVMKPELAEAA